MLKPIWPVLFVAIPLAVAIYLVVHYWGWWRNGDLGFAAEFWFPVVIGAIATVLACGICAALGCGLSDLIGEHMKQRWHSCWSGEMVSMRNSDQVSGSLTGGIFMISGSIGGDQTYFYYTLNKDGSYAPHKWRPDSDTSIYEEDRKDGEVQQFDMEFVSPLAYWIATPSDRLAMDFHVPKGSIKQEFSLK